ncbi:hypothetical protein F4803DRAFT_88393 [Xylaria telfairii]|nr:hypothetical protein F4803DRAFT_88393 [Xylaria telfairii]
MAELIGLVSGSIALVELAGKLSSCILTLKTLLTEVKEASRNLSTLLQEIEILELIIVTMSRELNDSNNSKLVDWNDSIIILSIKYGEKALGDLNSVLGDLGQEINTSKKLTKYKATFRAIIKKDVLDRCRARLQSAAHLLGLSQQWYIISLVKVQPTMIAEHLSHQDAAYRLGSNTNTQVIATHEPARNSNKYFRRRKPSFSTLISQEGGGGTPTTTNVWNFGPFGSLAWKYCQDERSPDPEALKFTARLQANYWFACRVWYIQASRAIIGWTIKLNTYCVQPDSSPVFWCARNGDIDGILRLTGQGKASLQDHTTSGKSLMHLAGEHGHLDLFKFLVKCGLDASEPEDMLKIKASEAMFVFGINRATDLAAWDQVYQENDIYGCLLLTLDEPSYFFEAMPAWPPEAFSTIIPRVLPRFHERLSLQERLKYSPFDNPDFHPDTFRLLINPSGVIQREDISNLEQEHICLLALVGFSYGPMVIRESAYHTQAWRKLVQEVILMTEDLSFRGFGLDSAFQSHEFPNKGLQFNPVLEFLQRNPPLTALFTVLSYYRYETQDHQTPSCPRDLRRRMHTTLTWWLEDLAAVSNSLDQVLLVLARTPSQLTLKEWG